MNVILVRKKSGKTIDFNLSQPLTIIIVVLVFSSLPIISYYFGVASVDRTPIMADINNPEHIEPIRNELNRLVGSLYKEELAQQRKELEYLKHSNRENIIVLTHNLAKLQAHIIRLDSLGSRLISVAKLDKKAFNFSESPAMGGADDGYTLKYNDFIVRMKQLTRDIDTKSKQLDILENLLLAEQLNSTITPSGSPSKNGWISSYFGLRKDPFSGKKKMHKGVDIAGQSGSFVRATADGIVISIKKQTGYGNVLEIDHGYGLSTRYGHNKTITVKLGELVERGQLIATMGSTGRSTGPHVHYEVLYNGKPVNPQRYIKTAQK